MAFPEHQVEISHAVKTDTSAHGAARWHRRSNELKEVRAPLFKRRYCLHEKDVAALVPFLLSQPPAGVDAVVIARRARHAEREAMTLNDLWRWYLLCAFSSLANSAPDAALGIFERAALPADGNLLDLGCVVLHGCDPEWVYMRLKEARLGWYQKKSRIVCAAYPLFVAMGRPHDRLADLELDEGGGPLKLCCDLARGRVEAPGFSEALDHTMLRGLAEKQLRNVLVNTGLATTVLPIDSRWITELARLPGLAHMRTASLTGYSYLAVEDLVRQALARARKSAGSRLDLPANLAELDAMVFGLKDMRAAAAKKKGLCYAQKHCWRLDAHAS